MDIYDFISKKTSAARKAAHGIVMCCIAAISPLLLLTGFAAMNASASNAALPELTVSLEEGAKVSGKLWEHIAGSVDWFRENYSLLLWQLLQILLVILLAVLVLRITGIFTHRMQKKKNPRKTPAQNKRTATYGTLLQSALTYVVVFITLWIILALVGLGQSISAAVAAASIGGIAIGFGAQGLVKDVTTGLFLLFEDQYAVGDYIKTNEAEGIVENAGVRVTYLRSLRGDQIIIPNGTIERVVNYTRGGYVASVDIGTSYESDTRMVMEIINNAVQAFANANPRLIVDRPTVLGIDRFEDSAVVIRVVCKSQPMKQWDVERGMRLAIKEAFDASGVPFPYPHVTLDGGTHRPQPQPTPPRQSGRPTPVWQKDGFDL